jgi:hypothetical protein
VFSKRHDDLPPDFAALELAAAYFDDPGSCFSLGEVMIANGISGDADRVWTSRVEGEWMVRLEIDGGWRAYSFLRQGDLAIPFNIVASDNLPETTAKDAIDALLLTAHRNGAPKVPRCANGGNGYRPPGLAGG